MSKQGYVYFAQMNPPDGPIKIGYSATPEGRIAALSIGSPYPIILVGVVCGTHTDERKLHKQFKDLNERGEWFRKTDELMQFVVALTQKEKPCAETKVEEPAPCLRDAGEGGGEKAARPSGRSGMLRRGNRPKDHPRKTVPPSSHLHLAADQFRLCSSLLAEFDNLFSKVDGDAFKFIDLAQRAFATKVGSLIQSEWERRHNVRVCRSSKPYNREDWWRCLGDHGEVYERDGKPVIGTADEYYLSLPDLVQIVAMCEERNLDVFVSGSDSGHFPSKTMRLEFTKRSPKP